MATRSSRLGSLRAGSLAKSNDTGPGRQQQGLARGREVHQESQRLGELLGQTPCQRGLVGGRLHHHLWPAGRRLARKQIVALPLDPPSAGACATEKDCRKRNPSCYPAQPHRARRAAGANRREHPMRVLLVGFLGAITGAIVTDIFGPEIVELQWATSPVRAHHLRRSANMACVR